jgi:hypothetical protein
MTHRSTRLGVAGLLLTLFAGSCGSPVATTPGARGGQASAIAGSGAGGAVAGEASGGNADDEPSNGGATVNGGATASGGTSSLPEDGGADPGGRTSNGGSTSHHAAPVSAKVDLLLTIDNSISMAEKQKLFAKTLPELLTRLVNPFCTDERGKLVGRVGSPNDACPVGSQREFAPLRDLHVGVITTSLGSHGSSGEFDVCNSPSDDDHAHLVGLQRPNLPSYEGRGFLKWDPDGRATPPGASDVVSFAQSLETMIVSAGEFGCGFEAPLEAIYRFLIDPEPSLSLELDANQRTKRVGIDQELLKQRADFLRPDSSVAVLLLTDENDCSVQDEGYGYLVTRGRSAMFRSTSACGADPNHNCCQSCGEATAHTGCPPIALDAECSQGRYLPTERDDLNLRCFDQKRRFGFDLLYPISRYVSAFSGGAVPDAQGNLVPNPLFHRAGRDRDPLLFSFSVLAGVPWQDLATSASLNGASLEYLTASELQTEGRWPIILGDPQTYTPPTDPFMRESSEPRSGDNPITHELITTSSSLDPNANSINGHEQVNVGNRDLQYACTFALPEPIICDQAAAAAGRGCDCFTEELSFNRPVCNPPGGGVAATTQYGGKAYPALRPLAVAKALGQRAVLGSICAPNTHDEEQLDFGYRPLFGALGRRIAETLVKP